MSTIINNGFVLNEKIDTIVPFLKEAKKQLAPFVEARMQSAMCNKIGELALRILDQGCSAVSQAEMKPANCNPGPSKYIDYLFERGDLLSWTKELVEAHAIAAENPFTPSSPDNDIACGMFLEVVLFPKGKKTYGMAFGSEELCEAFTALPQVSEFYFWDNTDRPKDITAAEWKNREKTWEELVPSFYPANDGFRYTLFQARTYLFQQPQQEQVETWLREHRQELVAKRTGVLLRAKLKALNPPPSKEETLSYYCDLQKMARDECKRGTAMAVQAMTTAEKEVPLDWKGIVALIEKEGGIS